MQLGLMFCESFDLDPHRPSNPKSDHLILLGAKLLIFELAPSKLTFIASMEKLA
jgi:hypothetical protein